MSNSGSRSTDKDSSGHLKSRDIVKCKLVLKSSIEDRKKSENGKKCFASRGKKKNGGDEKRKNGDSKNRKDKNFFENKKKRDALLKNNTASELNKSV